MKRLLIAVVSSIAALGAHAGCKDLAAAIEASDKELASLFASGIGEDSAARENVRQVKISNQLALIQANLLLMDRAHCPLPAGPFTENGIPWLSPAINCRTLQMKLDPDADAACTRAKWKSGTAAPLK